MKKKFWQCEAATVHSRSPGNSSSLVHPATLSRSLRSAHWSWCPRPRLCAARSNCQSCSSPIKSSEGGKYSKNCVLRRWRRNSKECSRQTEKSMRGSQGHHLRQAKRFPTLIKSCDRLATSLGSPAWTKTPKRWRKKSNKRSKTRLSEKLSVLPWQSWRSVRSRINAWSLEHSSLRKRTYLRKKSKELLYLSWLGTNENQVATPVCSASQSRW